jgi:hypothetical protein
MAQGAKGKGREAVTAWLLVFALAFAGGVGYLLRPATAWWWIASLAAVPLLVLVLVRAEKAKQHQEDGEHFGDLGGGPWWSP